MSKLAENILIILNKRECLETIDLVEELGIDHQKIVGAVKSLLTLDNVRFKKTIFMIILHPRNHFFENIFTGMFFIFL